MLVKLDHVPHFEVILVPIFYLCLVQMNFLSGWSLFRVHFNSGGRYLQEFLSIPTAFPPLESDASNHLSEQITTLPETNELPMKTPLFPCKYHQKGGFSMAMLVLGRV